MWSVDVFQLYLSTPLFQLFFLKADIVNSNTFSSLQKISKCNRPSPLLQLNMCDPVRGDSLWIQINETFSVVELKIMFPW